MRRMVLALLLSSYLPSADASMVIDGTRIIFSGDKKEIAVRATNMGETPSLTQVWVDDGRVQNQPEKDAAPFIVLPPIVRIEPGKGQSWRLVFNGRPPPPAGGGGECGVNGRPPAAGSGIAVLVQSSGYPT